MLYDWPVKPVNGPQPIFGTFGEFRGAAGDGLSTLHGGTDLALGDTNADVFSIDLGLVVRETPAVSGNPSAGGGGIRVGHFGYKHVKTINADPGNSKLPIYVVDRDSDFYVPKHGIANPAQDSDFDIKKITVTNVFDKV